MTIKELIEQLQILDKAGCGELQLLFIDENDMTHEIEEGVHDNLLGYVVLA